MATFPPEQIHSPGLDLTSPVSQGGPSGYSMINPGHNGWKFQETYWQYRENFQPVQIGNVSLGYPGYYVVEETAPRSLSDSNIVEFTRTYAQIPTFYHMFLTLPMTFPGFFPPEAFGLDYRYNYGDVDTVGNVKQGTTWRKLGSRIAWTKVVRAKVDVSFYKTDDPFNVIPVVQKFQPRTDAGAEVGFVSNNVEFRINTGQLIDPTDPSLGFIYELLDAARTTPSYVEYRAWAERGEWLCAEDTKVTEIWPGSNMWRVETVYVKAQ